MITWILIAATVVVSMWALQDHRLLHRLLLYPYAVQRRGEYYRLISYAAVHAGGQHLLFNMITLFFFGSAIEQFFAHHGGGLGYLGFYLGAAVVSVLPDLADHRDDPDYRSLGASGAVSAVLFGFILLHPWTTIYVFVLPLPAVVYAGLYVVYSLYQAKHGNDRINHGAHLWGGAFGVAVVALAEPRVLSRFVAQLLSPT